MKRKTKAIFKLIKKKYKWIILFLSMIIFLSLLRTISINEEIKIDIKFYEFAVIFLRTPTLTKIMNLITSIGSASFVITLTLILFIFIKNRKIGILIAVNLILISSLNLLLKNIVQRPRPEGYRLIEESGYSFPSGHSMVSTAFYGFLVYLIWKKGKNKKFKILSCILIGMLIPLIGFSRIYLGVHYATDVLAGGVLAISYLVAYTSIIKKWLVT